MRTPPPAAPATASPVTPSPTDAPTTDAPTSDARLAGLLRAVREAHAGGAWHGPALAEALALFDADDAAARPIPGAHTAWEIALHAAAWTGEVARRLAPGAVAGLPAPGDWPPMPDVRDAAAWSAARATADAALDACLAAAAAHLADPARLDHAVPRPADEAPDGATPSDALGARHDVAGTLAGLAAHLAYHAGQLTLLRRAVDAERAAAEAAR